MAAGGGEHGTEALEQFPLHQTIAEPFLGREAPEEGILGQIMGGIRSAVGTPPGVGESPEAGRTARPHLLRLEKQSAAQTAGASLATHQPGEARPVCWAIPRPAQWPGPPAPLGQAACELERRGAGPRPVTVQ